MVVGLSGVEELALGWRFSCARSTSGTVRCWGSNADGALGTGMPGDSLVPVAVFGLEDATAVSAGWAFGCALRRGETPVCWGDDHRDSLGNGGSDTSRSTPTPISPFPPPPPM
jgi:alpha-tubulin suppressor-like RCC1 family protein